ncbi:MAG: hypothetical protein J7L80_03000 [Thermoplasmata archaeon]|nr:hypothetical protein [Thermoplasmata archaeon]
MTKGNRNIIISVLVASVLILSAYIYSLYKPEKIELEGTIKDIILGKETAIVIINTTSGKEEIFECYLTWGIVLLAYSNEDKTYRFILTKSKDDRYYNLRYEEVK